MYGYASMLLSPYNSHPNIYLLQQFNKTLPNGKSSNTVFVPYLKHQPNPVPRINGDGHARTEVPTTNNPMNILLHFPNRQGRIRPAGLERRDGFVFQILPLQLLPILIPHKHLTYQNPLLLVPPCRRRVAALELSHQGIRRSRLVRLGQSQRGRAQEGGFE